MTGWVAIERDTFDNPIFAESEMSEREAYLWLVMNAAWEDTVHRVGGEVVPCPRGSLFITLREFQTTTCWGSDTKIRNFLQRLEDAELIKRTTHGKRNARKTHVTICNYGVNTDVRTEENAPETHRERTKNAVKEKGNNKQFSEPKGSSKMCVSEPDQGFEEFWKIWPVKTAKQNALKAWRKLSLELRREAFVAIRGGWFNRWQAANATANPIHASTFLNQKRWNDELPHPQLKPINGGKANGKPSITEMLFPSGAEVDLGADRNASQPFSSEGYGWESGSRGHDGLDQGAIRVLPRTDFGGVR